MCGYNSIFMLFRHWGISVHPPCFPSLSMGVLVSQRLMDIALILILVKFLITRGASLFPVSRHESHKTEIISPAVPKLWVLGVTTHLTGSQETFRGSLCGQTRLRSGIMVDHHTIKQGQKGLDILLTDGFWWRWGRWSQSGVYCCLGLGHVLQRQGCWLLWGKCLGRWYVLRLRMAVWHWQCCSRERLWDDWAEHWVKFSGGVMHTYTFLCHTCLARTGHGS